MESHRQAGAEGIRGEAVKPGIRFRLPAEEWHRFLVLVEDLACLAMLSGMFYAAFVIL